MKHSKCDPSMTFGTGLTTGALFIALLAGIGHEANGQELKVDDLNGLPAGGCAAYSTVIVPENGRVRTAASTVSWLQSDPDGGVWLEFARDEGKTSQTVRVLADHSGRALRMSATEGKGAASRSDKLPPEAGVLSDRSHMLDKGDETIVTAAGIFACRHYSQATRDETQAKKGDLSLVTAVEKQHDVWLTNGPEFSGLVKERTSTTISEHAYLAGRVLPKKCMPRKQSEVTELVKVTRAGAHSRIKD